MNLRSLLPTFGKRSLENPAVPLSSDAAFGILGAQKSRTGLSVTPENSLEASAVWAAVRMISGTVSTLPLQVFRETNSGKEKAREHPVYGLLHDRPNPEMSSVVWREAMMAHLLLWGNHYSEIERNAAGQPVALWPLPPAAVSVQWIGDKKWYLVRIQGQDVSLPAEDMLHIPGFTLDGQLGLVPSYVGRESIGLTKAAEQYGATFFENGATPSGILTHPGKLKPDSRESLRTSWENAHKGLTKAHRVAILEEGLTWTAMGVSPEEAQMLETRRFQVSEIARLFGLPPHLIGDLDRATFSNIEQQHIQYVTLCIAPWCKRLEAELSYKLLDRGHSAEFNLEGLLRGDSAARAEFYSKLFAVGALSVNDILAKENMNGIGAAGDQRFVPLNLVPLDGPRPEPKEAPSE